MNQRSFLQTLKVDKSNERKWLYTGSWRYAAETIRDADNANDIVLLANTPTQAKPRDLEACAGSR